MSHRRDRVRLPRRARRAARALLVPSRPPRARSMRRKGWDIPASLAALADAADAEGGFAQAV